MKRFVAVLGLCALPALAIAQADRGADRFQRWFALDLDGTAAYYALTLPPGVYAASRRDDLGDLRVVNGAGEPVPYSLEAPQTVAKPPALQPAKWFPVPPAEAGAPGAPLGVTIAADGSLRAATTTPPRPTREVDLVDLGRVDGVVGAVLVHLRNDNFQGRVGVDASDDLRVWRSVTDVPLLKVSHGGDLLLQERVDLGRLRARYLRLRWRDGAPEIAGVEVEVWPTDAPAGADAARQWRDGITARPGQVAGEYRFETGGAYPVDRLRFTLPQPNTVARVTVFSRGNDRAPWRVSTSGVLFRLHGKAGEQGNPPLEIAPNTDREWRVVVDMRNGGLGSGTLSAAVGWRPALLTFVARGAGPFALAVGNAAVTSTASRRGDLLVGGSDIATARLGEALAAPPSLQASAAAAADTDATRRYVLWGALLLAVAVLGAMAWRLARAGLGSTPAS